MKPILVHLHIYYQEQYLMLKDCLLNLKDYPFKLWVTMVEEHAELISDLKVSFKDCKIEIVENLGYDVSPFVHVINEVNLDEYSYVIKLHTKRDVLDEKFKEHRYYGSAWRDFLLSFIKDKSTIDKVISTLENHQNIGMSANINVIIDKLLDPLLEQEKTKEFIENRHLPFVDYRYVTGTMFIARASVFKALQSLKLKTEDFEVPDAKHNSCQLAHVIERFMGYIVYLNHMQIIDCTQSLYKTRLYFWHLYLDQHFNVDYKYEHYIKELFIRKFVLKYLVSVRKTKKNKLLVKIFRIPILSIKCKK